MIKDDAAMADEEDRMPDPEAEDAEPETFELELDGRVHTLPAALRGAFLRQADYTRKTQELAAHRRAVEAERQAVAAERATAAGASADRATLTALDHQLASFAGVDWQALGAADPGRARALWAAAQETRALRDQFAYALSHHETRQQIQAAREAAEEMAATGRTLSQEIEGWSPEVATKLVEYAQAFGVTNEELSQMADPRLWRLLHRAWRADQGAADGGRAAVVAVRPAVTVSGGGAAAGGVRDELGTKEWMRRRNEQMARVR